MAIRVSELKEQGGRGGYAELEDRLLVLDFQAGNEDGAYVEIYRRYSGLARHICQRILGNAEDADEATQEAMLRVFQGLHRFNGRYAVQPWVARIATNVALDVVRARARRPQASDTPLDEAELHLEAGDPELAVERRLDQARVKAVLAVLPSHHREALVLREFEGKSHEQIGQALGVTAPQAKALIHRAKKSFRKAWEGQAPTRHRSGVALLVPIFLAPLRIPGALRRLVHPVQEAASVAAASPAVATAGASAGERVAAAAVAVLVAGTAAVGAVTLRNAGHDKVDVPEPAVVALAPAPVAPLVVATPERQTERHKGDRGRQQQVNPQPIPVPVDSPSEAPSSEPTVPPSESPSPDPSGEPSPPIGPPPAWSLAFSSTVSSEATCGCSAASSPATSQVTGTEEEGFTFAQTVRGAALDAEGDAAWALYLEYAGVAGPEGGHLDVAFILTTEDANYRYQGSGTLAETTTTTGAVAYRFAGSYYLTDEVDESVTGIPRRGELSVTVGFWDDGTLYDAGYRLYEA